MEKEKIITIAIGLGLGLLVAVGFFVYSKYQKSPPKTISVDVKTATITPTPTIKTAQFSITSPTNDVITKETEITVSGTAENDGSIIIISNVEEKKVVPKDGTFETKVKLEEGDNKIQVIYLETGKDPIVITRSITQDV